MKAQLNKRVPTARNIHIHATHDNDNNNDNNNHNNVLELEVIQGNLSTTACCFVFCFVSSCCSAVVFVADASSTTEANHVGPIRNQNSKGAIEKRNASERPTSVDYLF